jgi:allophanate hydrolase subunit 2
VLGSRATDVLAGLGRVLVAGDDVPVGTEVAGAVPASDLALASWPGEEIEAELLPGPRADWFSPASLDTLFSATWVVSADADRVGARLDGPPLERIVSRELPSEGMVPGALQVPPSSRPTVLLADGPVTGGYPVIAVTTAASLDALAQARPGTRLRFRRARQCG